MNTSSQRFRVLTVHQNNRGSAWSFRFSWHGCLISDVCGCRSGADESRDSGTLRWDPANARAKSKDAPAKTSMALKPLERRSKPLENALNQCHDIMIYANVAGVKMASLTEIPTKTKTPYEDDAIPSDSNASKENMQQYDTEQEPKTP